MFLRKLWVKVSITFFVAVYLLINTRKQFLKLLKDCNRSDRVTLSVMLTSDFLRRLVSVIVKWKINKQNNFPASCSED